MLIFDYVQWRNFLSTGDAPIRIDLAGVRSTLIVGANGCGKSTMLDALSFALFGKPHRKVNKPQLVNSINNKNCEVEVGLSAGGTKYRIRRGIKPNIFEIWRDGTLVNQESHTRDYQKILETNILKLNHKSFHQVVVLGASNFTPFMQLPAASRREVIEDLLDIGVFSKMSALLKEEDVGLREKLKDIEYDLRSLSDRISLQGKHIKELRELDDQKIKEVRAEINSLEEECEELDDLSGKYRKEYENNIESVLNELHRFRGDRDALVKSKQEVMLKIKGLVEQSKMYEEKPVCPTCDRDINEEIRRDKLEGIGREAKGLHRDHEFAVDMLSKNQVLLDESLVAHKDLLDQKRRSEELDIKKRGFEVQIAKLLTKLKETNSTDLGKATDDLNKQISEQRRLEQERGDVAEKQEYNRVIAEILRDTGIKSKIVRQYLPVMNRFINEILNTLDFFVSFYLDDGFNEVIKSRHRDHFKYESFSEGQKSRIDLALLFAWRQVAKMKNSVNTNLLVLDEIFDSSLDDDGVENLHKILNSMDGGVRTFVISHKGDVLMDGKFDRKIEFSMPKNFSQMTVSS